LALVLGHYFYFYKVILAWGLDLNFLDLAKVNSKKEEQANLTAPCFCELQIG
jgi:hypothetical protein